MRNKILLDRGKFKTEISSALYKNSEIREVLLGDTSGMKSTDIQKEFKKYVKSHLFIDDTISEAKTFIFYDVRLPSIHSQLKQCTVLMYLISDRDTLDDYYKEGYYGDKIDILSQMVVNTLINDEETSNNFGIGKLSLGSVDIYNATKFYGCVLSFDIDDFR